MRKIATETTKMYLESIRVEKCNALMIVDINVAKCNLVGFFFRQISCQVKIQTDKNTLK